MHPRRFLLLALFAVACASGRSEAYRGLLETLNADLLASSSATATLERWCADHAMAAEPKIVVQRVEGVQKAPSAEQLQRLQVGDANELKYRRVRLRCGEHTLSEADNWYVPARLTAEMNAQLDTTDIPFGRVVRPLAPYRRTIEARVLWSPPRFGVPVIPKEVMVHRAVLYTPDHQPFSEVVETYQGELFAFGER